MRQFWAAIGTSATQPVGAVIAYLAGAAAMLALDLLLGV